MLGSAGTLISQRCADGDHLALHDPNAGDESKDPKPIKWRLDKTDAVPVAADSFIGALDPGTGSWSPTTPPRARWPPGPR